MAKKKTTKKKVARTKTKKKVARKGKPGMKQCPSCGKQVGVRTMTCDCGHVFRAVKKKTKQKPVPFDEPPKQPSYDIPAIVAATRLIEAMGSPAKAKSLIDEVGRSL